MASHMLLSQLSQGYTCYRTALGWIWCHGKLVAGQGWCLEEVGLEADSGASSCGQVEQLHLEVTLLKVLMSLDANKAIGHTPQKHQLTCSDLVTFIHQLWGKYKNQTYLESVYNTRLKCPKWNFLLFMSDIGWFFLRIEGLHSLHLISFGVFWSFTHEMPALCFYSKLKQEVKLQTVSICQALISTYHILAKLSLILN